MSQQRSTAPERIRASLGADAPVWSALLPFVAFAAAALQLGRSAVDPDYWWHLTTGLWMLDHGRIPVTDPFSATHGGQTWYAHEWLAELLIGIVDKIAGYAGEIVITASIVAAGAWLLGRSARYLGSGALPAFILVACTGFFILGNLAVRPQVWGWALLAVLLHELAAYETGRRYCLWHLPLVFAFWINIHLSALMGGAALALYVLHLSVRRLTLAATRPYRAHAEGTQSPGPDSVAGWPSRAHAEETVPSSSNLVAGCRKTLVKRIGPGCRPAVMGRDSAGVESRLRHVFPVALLSALALNLNPRGPALLWFTRVYADPNAVRYRYIGEWQRPSFNGSDRWLFVAAGAIVLLIVAAMIWRRSIWPGVLVPLFAAASLRATRYVPLFALVSVPAAGWFVGGALRSRRGLVARRVPAPLIASLAVATALAVWAGAYAGGASQLRRVANPVQGGYPVDAAAWVKANVPGGTVFGEYGWGGYLIHVFYPERRVYIDGREEMYGERFFGRFVRTIGAEPGWQDTLAEASVRAALIDPTGPLAAAMASDPGWRRAFSDRVAAVYIPTARDR